MIRDTVISIFLQDIKIAIETGNLRRLKSLINSYDMQYAIEMVIEKGRYSWVPELISDVSVENITTYFYRSHITDPEFDSLVAETYRSLPPKKVKELGENLEKLIGMLRIMPMMLRKDSDQYPAVRLHSRCWRLCT